jgi:eukaryotic-like serine/threonine-protein kinase
MTRRRTVLALIIVAGFCLAGIAPVLGSPGPSGWRVKALAAGAAVALFGAGMTQTRASALLDRRRQDQAELERGIYTPGGRPPLIRDLASPLSVGVHAAARPDGADGTGRLPPYVPRDIDPGLHQALLGSGFILLVGAAAVGKTRTAYEAIRAVLPDHVFIAPGRSDDIPAAVRAARAERHCVLWLDSLQRYLGAGAITSQAIAELLAGDGHHRVVLATLRAAEESRLIAVAGSLSGGQSLREGQAVLDLADHRIVLEREFTGPERSRAAELAAQDSRLADALRHADRYGVPEYLSSGPQLFIECSNAWERGSHPAGAALVDAAVDCRRAGFAAPLPRALLDELSREYLDRHGGTELRPEPLAAAWAWAIELRDSGSSPLSPVGQGSYDVFDYLVDVRAREPTWPVPESTVLAALRFAGPADAVTIAGTAWYQGRPELAEAGFRSAYAELISNQGPDAAATLASRSDLAVTLHAAGKLPDAEAEYRAILSRRTATIGPTHPETLASRSNLAVVLHDRRQLDEAEEHYRAVLDLRTTTLGAEHPSTLITRNNLGVLLEELGRLAEAEAELDEVVRLRAKVLGPDHPNTAVSRANLEMVRRKLSGR